MVARSPITLVAQALSQSMYGFAQSRTLNSQSWGMPLWPAGLPCMGSTPSYIVSIGHDSSRRPRARISIVMPLPIPRASSSVSSRGNAAGEQVCIGTRLHHLFPTIIAPWGTS
eukprot:scaffold19358_cov123-Isochrysis_galbana.AAC.2